MPDSYLVCNSGSLMIVSLEAGDSHWSGWSGLRSEEVQKVEV